MRNLAKARTVFAILRVAGKSLRPFTSSKIHADKAAAALGLGLQALDTKLRLR